MSLPKIIAIDGPAASGKSTLGKNLADLIGYMFIDTGLMYRAVTWTALQQGLPLDDENTISALAEQIMIDIRPTSTTDGRSCDLLVDGKEVSQEIRRPDVDENVSLVASYSGVREALTAQQRRIGLQGQVVMVGRDIGTVVLPEAEVKIFLNASVEERAQRRFREVVTWDTTADYQSILESMRARDRFDSNRILSPLRPAEDAIILDTDGKDAEEVLNLVLDIIKSE